MFCHTCRQHVPRLHSCLYCVYFGCYADRHIFEHAKVKKHNLGPHHNYLIIQFLLFTSLKILTFILGIDLTYGVILCFLCGDYVYDDEIDEIARNEQKLACRSLGLNYQHFTFQY